MHQDNGQQGQRAQAGNGKPLQRIAMLAALRQALMARHLYPFHILQHHGMHAERHTAHYRLSQHRAEQTPPAIQNLIAGLALGQQRPLDLAGQACVVTDRGQDRRANRRRLLLGEAKQATQRLGLLQDRGLCPVADVPDIAGEKGGVQGEQDADHRHHLRRELGQGLDTRRQSGKIAQPQQQARGYKRSQNAKQQQADVDHFLVGVHGVMVPGGLSLASGTDPAGAATGRCTDISGSDIHRCRSASLRDQSRST